MMERLGVRNAASMAPMFSLCECLDAVTISRCLAPTESIAPLLTAWEAKGLRLARLVLRVYTYGSELLAQSQRDKALQHLLFTEAVYNVVTGVYPTTLAEATRLASFQLQAKFGDHDPVRHRPGFLMGQLPGLIPPQHRPTSSLSDVESSILTAHRTMATIEKLDPERAYLDSLVDKPYYGCEFYFVIQSFTGNAVRGPPKKVLVGIYRDGIHLHRPVDKDIVDKFPLAELYRWGFKRNETFYWELKPAFNRNYPATVAAGGGKGPLFQVSTKEGKNASDQLTAYAMLVLAEIKKRRASAAPPTDPKVQDPTEKAATKVAALYRGYRLRSELQRKSAATMIQALVRGVRARKQFEAMLDDLEQELAE